MNREELFACLEKASEAFAAQAADAVAAQEEEQDEFELRMQDEELAALVAKEMGLL